MKSETRSSAFRIALAALLLVAIHFAVKLFIFDSAQQSANSHMNNAHSMAYILGGFTAIILIASITRILRKKGSFKSYFLAALGLSLLPWIPVLFKVICEHCAMGG